MAAQSILSGIIGLSTCIAGINKRFALTLAIGHLITLQFIRSYNVDSVKCGYIHIEVMFRLNSRRRSATDIKLIFDDLAAAGLLTWQRKGTKRGLLGLTVTQSGLQVLNEFERLLRNYKVKGLPESV